MSQHIVYNGPSNVQEFSAADFKKEDVDARKVSFTRGEPTEVDDEVASLLLEGRGVFEGFDFAEADDPESASDAGGSPDGEGDNEASLKGSSKKKTSTRSGRVSQSTDGGGGSGTAGVGTASGTAGGGTTTTT